MILELREFLSEHVQTCFYTHYYFEHNSKRISDYTDVSELDLAASSTIYMRADIYDERASRQHVARLKDILSNP